MNPARTLVVDVSGPDLTPAEAASLRRCGFGGVCLFARNFSTPARTARLVEDLRDVLGERALIATDQEGGAVLRRLDVPLPPTPQALGVLDDEGVAAQAGEIAARGLSELGINWNFAPSLDVNADPLNPVIGERSFGANPAQVARLGLAWARGSESAGVMSAVKHFPGHGDTRVDSHLALPVVTKTRAALEQTEWLPFRAAAQSGVGSVMTAHVLYPAVDAERPATVSPAFLTGLLRREWGYDGVVVTDALDMRAVADRYPHGQASVLALAAGADAALVCGHGETELAEVHVRALQVAARSGQLTEVRLSEALRRLDRAAERFPGIPRPYPVAQRGEDEAALRRWAKASLTRHGDPPTLDPAAPAWLVAPETAPVGGPYGDSLGGAALAEALRVQLPQLRWQPLGDLQAVQAALDAEPSTAALLATTGRWGLPPGTLNLARALARRPGPALHLALWDPHAAAQLPLPALVTHGFRPANLQALAEALVEKPGAGA